MLNKRNINALMRTPVYTFTNVTLHPLKYVSSCFMN